MEKHLGMLQQINQVNNKVNYKAIDAAYAEFIGFFFYWISFIYNAYYRVSFTALNIYFNISVDQQGFCIHQLMLPDVQCSF